MTYISITNQCKLLDIPRSDVHELMLSGINFLDASILTYVSQIEGIEQEILHDSYSLAEIKNAISDEDFTLSEIGSLIKIDSTNKAPSLFFLTEKWNETLSEMPSYNKAMHVLIPHRSEGPMFIGGEENICRLSDSFDGDYDIIPIEEIEGM